jgi:type IV pilus assembly protein PilB
MNERIEKRLREKLTAQGLLTAAVEARIKEAQARGKLSFLDAAVETRAVPRPALLEAVGDVFDVPHIDLDTTFGDALILDVLPKDQAFKLKAIPLFLVERQLTVVVADPSDLHTLDALRFATNKEILPVVAPLSDILRHLPEYYGAPAEAMEADVPDNLEFEASEEKQERSELSLEAASEEKPVVRLVNVIMMRALQDGASDIHIEPREHQVVVRYRVDGRLQVKPYSIPAGALPALVSRIKVLSGLDIAERRVPQDGKFRVRGGGRAVDVRVSTFPTIRDEKVVMRLLDKQKNDFRLDNLGMSPHVISTWRRIIRQHQGIVLVTGPTGSGKSSTLFATLRDIDKPEVNIVTLEDPVEYELETASQGQVNDKAGFTFAKGLRAILRQDPDVILVGEIRDPETAQIAVQAALTGHLVLASLHTNDAVAAITRLQDVGIAPYLLSAAVIGVLAQRLLRKLCPECTKDAEPTAEEKEYLAPWLPGASDLPFLEGSGCGNCHSSGYRGRTAVHEVLETTPEVRTLIAQQAGTEAIAAAARAGSYRSLWQDGLEKVRARKTSLRELARVVDHDEAAS